MKPRICAACPHEVGQHSHIAPHVCKADKCNCWGYVRQALANSDTKEHA